MQQVEHMLSMNCELGEGPIWYQQEQKLYWVDILRNTIHAYHPGSGDHQATCLFDHICALGLRSKGGFVIATRKHFAFWDGQSTEVEVIGEVEADLPQNRFNDGAVDRQGRFWVGTMNNDAAAGSLYRLNPDLSVEKMVTGVRISNGVGWSPDNRTMYFTDSPLKRIFAFAFDPASGALSSRRVHIQVPDGVGVPDGLTVDSEGFIWSAHWDGYRLTRYTPQGEVDRVVTMPVGRPTSVTFGGPALTDLFITSAWTGYSDHERQQKPLAGDIFKLSVDVAGLPEPYFSG